jgi:probable HAF family extracellular repeat protein
MKSTPLLTVAATILLTALMAPVQLGAQEETRPKRQLTRYTVMDLGPTQSFAEGINNRGWVAGTKILADGVTQHAFVWRNGRQTDLGTFGGPNSSAFSKPSEWGQVAGNAETSTPDPMGEDFCAYGTHFICLAFVWQKGVMTSLPTLGGNNGWATGGVNNRGQVGGTAENATLDATCANPAYEARPAIWEKESVRDMPTLPGDPDGSVFEINDHGQAVGATTDCAASPTIFHAVRWQNGTVTDLGGFGGVLNNSANGINNRGHVVGVSDLPGDTSFHAFLWKDGIMTDLGTLYGLPSSWAFGINDEEQIVGMDCDANFDCGAFLWQDGTMTDLNTLLPNNTPWNLIVATNINARGEIVATAENNGFHTVLLTPCDERQADRGGCKGEGAAAVQRDYSERPKAPLSEHARRLVWQHVGLLYRINQPAGMTTGTAKEDTGFESSACSAGGGSDDYLSEDERLKPLVVYGNCVLDAHNKLDGGCIGRGIGTNYCLGGSGGTACPVGSMAKKPGFVFCLQARRNIPVDQARRCPLP